MLEFPALAQAAVTGVLPANFKCRTIGANFRFEKS